MVRVGRKVPEPPAEVLFSDIELGVLVAGPEGLAPQEHLGEAVELLLARKDDSGAHAADLVRSVCGTAIHGSRP